MSEPILSYKRPSSRESPASPAVPASSPNPQSQSASPKVKHHAGARKVSSRRRALQDFYNISSDEPTTKKSDPDSLPSPEELNNIIQNSSINDILKLRNRITHTLNSQDSAKKSIIYDNYYELIKLSETLSDLSKGMHNEVNGLGIYEEKQESKEKFMDDVLSDLHDFINSEDTKMFNRPFEEILDVPQEVTSSKVLDEVNQLLNIKGNLDEQEKEKVASQIDSLIEKLPQHELLQLQLNKLKQRL
ncbi:uncharacterized protein SPAPADRAFT_63319 [Spathaspora passalidarum NRRL Y-27907]|uniref:Vacuolar protein sorting-associated protein 51 homolog n=1 Tax=Spathaspora passalidarum (strain NRRL Y-27907 / 11-Y1) TaxID=619300 RepID=G3AUC4_SPAPN|nr:uncharacterized protein SPAPADRAFT_63319 [Spathaspora passalidarum NRRL Y-27907]EGW30500.1 hypothetical protein SPAPADRAFT_63319 [Spathaspora passalidarum NRRL Y-27907]